ncbi:MAG: ADP-ribosylglycohydrolase family protein [Chloroflexota bacterium]|nr:ADP-ribosylglycohydrolase family protein [Chloroflexota bacterium]MDE2945689.1 ADP-ribosylglycohydrolase family protein [Chloroflexota bacterium]
MTNYNYPEGLQDSARTINLWAQLKTETGAAGIPEKLAEIKSLLAEKLTELRALPDDPALRAAEPDDLDGIRALRPAGTRRYWTELPEATYRDRLEGAWLGRCAGCTLGSIVELWAPEQMEAWAAYLGEAFPPADYWSAAERPFEYKYETSRRDAFTPAKMDGVPTDDDLIYTQLGMLILEDYGIDFSTDDVGAAWVKYLPVSPASPVLGNLQAGIPANQAAAVDNPTMFWIIGDIQSDPWGYAAPGYPEKAAEFSWRNATVSSRRNGIYGAMYFSAVIAAAFATGDPLQALEAGLAEIPADCVLAREVRWALDIAGDIKDYRAARAAAEERYAGMHPVHTINNVALTIWGLNIGGDNFTKVIGETVAMGLDNDCTAASAGSIFGAAYGKDAIPEHWTRNFNNKAHSFIIGKESFAIDDMIDRFTALARRVHA